MKYLLFFLSFLCLVACNKTKDTIKEDSLVNLDSVKLSVADISKINYIDYGVDAKAKNTLDSWQAYNTIAAAVEGLKSADFSFFQDDKTVFDSTIKDLETTVPEKVNSEPVQARLLILKTKLLKLEEILNLNTAQKKEKLLVMKELFQAFSNVTLQINKKFEKEAQNIIKPNEI